MKTFIYYDRFKGKTYSMNLKAHSLWEAYDLEDATGMELMGEKVDEITDIWKFLFKRFKDGENE